MTRWLVLCGVLCSGCDLFFSLHHFEHDAGVDAAPDAPDAGAPMPCSKMSMLADSFEDNTLSRMWPASNGFGDFSGFGHADLTQSMNANLESDRYYDLRDDHFQLALTTTGFNFFNADQVQLAVTSTRPGYSLTITLNGRNLRFDRIEDGAILSMGSVIYDPVMHKYWRIANAGGVTTFETGPSPTDFTVQTSMAGLDYVAFMRVTLNAHTASNPGYLLDIDDVNGGTPMGSACPMTVLADRFDGTTIDDRWARTVATSQISEHDGYLEMALLQTTPTNTYFTAATIYDLTAAPFSVEIPQMLDVGSTSTQVFAMVASNPDGEIIQFREGAGIVYALYSAPMFGNNNTINMKPYDPVAHRWWRFRIAGKFTKWETSADGVVWDDTWGSTNNLNGFARTDVYFQTIGMTASTDAVHLDNVDLPPL